MSELLNYININIYNWKEAKQFHTASYEKQQQSRAYREVANWRQKTAAMAIHPGKQERFRPLSRDFFQDCWRSKAALKPKSSTTRCCLDDRGRLAISERISAGLRLIFFLLDFPEETRKLLGPGTLTEAALTGTYSTRPSSTTLEILTPDRDAESSEDGLMPPTTYHCSCESLCALRRSSV